MHALQVIPLDVSLRMPTGGLPNTGNSCYLNVSVQALFSCADFMDGLKMHPTAANDSVVDILSKLYDLRTHSPNNR